MKILNKIMLSGYIALRQGERSFREWIVQNAQSDEFPVSLIMFQYDEYLNSNDASVILKSEFDLNEFVWPESELNESEYLQRFLVYLYFSGDISGVELAFKCKALNWDFSTPTKYKSIWDGICEDVETVKYPPPHYFFCLKGHNIELEIAEFLSKLNIESDL